MSRLNVPAPEDVPAGVQRILDRVGAQLGFVPNMFRTIASNPAVLEVVTTLQDTLSRVLHIELDSRGRVSDAELAGVRGADGA